MTMLPRRGRAGRATGSWSPAAAGYWASPPPVPLCEQALHDAYAAARDGGL
ncbi:MAG: hypothetical protein ACLUNZ_12530 [Evtepia sp.]